jgi:hypothetical protein
MPEEKDRNVLEAVLEGAETYVDLATENEAVKSIPVVGTALKLLRDGLKTIRQL